MPASAASAKLLLILRHAQAESGRPGVDRERPLTAAGRAALRQTALAAQRRAWRPTLIVTSPAVRAHTSAAAFRELVAPGCPLVADERVYAGEAVDLLCLLRELPPETACVLLVGHNPTLEDLVRLLAGDECPADGLRPGALAALRPRAGDAWADLAPGRASVESLLWHQP
jgi:phosphohistidine phosphatase